MIEFLGIKKKLGTSFELVINSLKINSNDFVILIGNNGAGKTTMLKLILDLITPDHGVVYSFDCPVKSDEKWKMYTGVYLDESFLVPYLTAKEYFQLILECKGYSKQDISVHLLPFTDFLAWEAFADNGSLIRTMSKGEKQKIGIVASFIGKPKVIILDEPFSFLDPRSQTSFIKILNDHHSGEGCLIILSSHNLAYLERIGNRIIALDNGHIIKDVEKNEGNIADVLHFLNRP